MWEAPFVNTFQNKDNLLYVYQKDLQKLIQNAEKCYCFLLYFHFSFKLAKISMQLFYLSIYLFVFQLTMQKIVDQKECSFFLPFF